jgi:anti-sigma B factor antagonist
MLASLVAETRGSDSDAAAVLTVAGELDIAAAPRLRSAVGDLMGQGVRHLEVDLDACTFIDSSGMGALLWASHRMKAAGGDLAAVHVHGPAMRALEVAGLNGILAVRP